MQLNSKVELFLGVMGILISLGIYLVEHNLGLTLVLLIMSGTFLGSAFKRIKQQH